MYKQEETLKVVHRNIFRFKTQRREREKKMLMFYL